jgi:hypothetical protein
MLRPLLTLSAIAGCHAATAAALDGPLAEGDLTVAADAVTVGATRIALSDLDWVRPGTAEAPPLAATPLGVYLVDGSWLPATAIAAGDAKDVLRVNGPLGSINLPLSAIRGWAAAGLPEAQPGKDAIVGPSGPVGGRITGITGKDLLLITDLDPEPVPVPVTAILACRLAGADKAVAGPVLAWSIRPDRPAIRLKPGTEAVLAAAPSVRIGAWTQPPLASARLTAQGGRRVWLSDLKPASVEEAGSFGVTCQWKKDADLDGGPLRLGGVLHAKGLTVHSRAKLTWTLGAAYGRFATSIGISDLVAPEGDCVATISGDGKPLWTGRLRGGERPVAVEVPVAGVQALDLVVDPGERHDIGDHVSLGSAWLVRTK